MLEHEIHHRRKFKVKLPTIWTDEKQRWEEPEKSEEERRSRFAKRLGKSRNTLFFQWFVVWRSTSRLAKAAGAEPCGQMRNEKLHAVVARSTFPNAQSTQCSGHFWKLRCRKSARRCGAKHISKSKVQKTEGVRTTFGCSDVVSRGRRKGLCTLSKVSKT